VAGGYVEFVKFGSRLAALVWLHHSLSKTLADGGPFVDRIRMLLRAQRVIGVDEPPAWIDGWLEVCQYGPHRSVDAAARGFSLQSGH
jgi:hypothetical protein